MEGRVGLVFGGDVGSSWVSSTQFYAQNPCRSSQYIDFLIQVMSLFIDYVQTTTKIYRTTSYVSPLCSTISTCVADIRHSVRYSTMCSFGSFKESDFGGGTLDVRPNFEGNFESSQNWAW